MKMFEWDKWVSEASYAEVRDCAGRELGIRPPSCFSPDGKWVYFSASDIAAKMESGQSFETTGKWVLDKYESEIRNVKEMISRGRYYTMRQIFKAEVDVCLVFQAAGRLDYESFLGYDYVDRFFEACADKTV